VWISFELNHLNPFALSLSKGCPFLRHGQEQGQGFDKLSPNGEQAFPIK
jgi:hypothetical protein